MRVFKSAITLCAALAITACVGNGNEPSTPPAKLQGVEWVVEDIDARGVIDYARLTIQFGQDGRLSGNTSCNSYFADYEVDGARLQIKNTGATKRACVPAVMDMESRFLAVLNAVNRYHIDSTGALVVTTPAHATITARDSGSTTSKTTYRCSDDSLIEAWYPTNDTAKITYDGRLIDMVLVVSASGARYVGGGWQWWTKGRTEGLLAPLADGESIASAGGMTCTSN